MKQQLKKCLGRGFVLLLLAALMSMLALALVKAHGDEDHEKVDGEQEIAADSLATDQQQLLDSILVAINESYQQVKPIFAYSCFDCHSDSTDYPWYVSLPLVGGFMRDHGEEAREHVDMSNDFPFGGHGNQLETLHEMKEEIEDGEMPLLSYRLMHWGRLIEGAQQDSVFAWIDSSRALLKPFMSEGEDDDDNHDDDDHDED